MASPACSILQPPGLVVSLDFGTSFSGVAAKALGSDPDVLNNFPYQAGDLTFGWITTPALPASVGARVAGSGSAGAWAAFNDDLDGWDAISCTSSDPAASAAGTIPKVAPAVTRNGEPATPTYELVDTGYAADSKYTKMSPHERAAHVLLSRFKLHLAHPSPASLAPLPPGLGLERVISDYLEGLHRQALAWLARSRYAKMWDEAAASYVLTVPASWSDQAKDTMRRCAHQAGIIPDAGSRRLQLVHEPEAAAVALVKEYWPALSLAKGDTILVLDLGGGTADITLHELVPGKDSGDADHLREIACRRAELAGSTFLDDRFWSWLGAEVGDAGLLTAWREERPADYLRLMKAWEETKRTFKGDNHQGNSKVQLPLSLWRRLPLATKQALCGGEEDEDDDEAQHVVLSMRTMEGYIFKPVVDQILDAAQPMTHWDGGVVDYVFVAGGFAASPYVLRRLEAQLGRACTHSGVLVASNPGAAVLKGAVIYGDCPRLIAGRISSLSYGVQASIPYKLGMPGKPSFSPLTRHLMCDVSFRAFALKGQYVGVDEEVRHIFGTTYPCQTAADVRVYCTPKACEEFISDPGMRRLGAVRLEMPPPHTEGSRELEVVFKFGGAEIEVTAADVVSGKEVRASLQFLTGV